MQRYFKDRKTFFVIFASDKGLKLYFKDNEYQLRKDLHISLKKMDTGREFRIEAYGTRVFVEGTRNTYRGYVGNGLEIEMYIDQNGKIISAFPKE